MEYIGMFIVAVSMITAGVLDVKYKIQLMPAIWYSWGAVSMLIGLFLMLLGIDK